MSLAVRRCELILRKAVEAGFVQRISQPALTHLIRKHVGGDPRTVQRYTKHMVEFGYLKAENRFVFKLVLPRVPGLLELAVQKGRQEKLV